MRWKYNRKIIPPVGSVIHIKKFILFPKIIQNYYVWLEWIYVTEVKKQGFGKGWTDGTYWEEVDYRFTK